MTPPIPEMGERAASLVKNCQIAAAPNEDLITLDERWREQLVADIALALTAAHAQGRAEAWESARSIIAHWDITNDPDDLYTGRKHILDTFKIAEQARRG